jgi:two-component system, LytTR family, response regulator
MKALIVDDEPIARRVLREELELLPDVLVVGEAGDGKEALQEIAKLAPDVVFLDLQMPVMSGFEVVRNLKEPPLPVIVIVTAFDQHAIEAFEAGAIDYLLKPVGEARLRTAVERARTLHSKPAEVAARLDRIAAAAQPSSAPRSRKVVGRNGEEYFFLDVDDVLAFQAERELVWIVTSKQRLLATQSLRVIEGKRLTNPLLSPHRGPAVMAGWRRGEARKRFNGCWLGTINGVLRGRNTAASRASRAPHSITIFGAKLSRHGRD